MYRIGIDVGGTFTDLVAADVEGRVTMAKAASTPEDQSLGVMEGLTLLAREHSLDLRAFLEATDLVVHGTTVATNALLERKGAAVGMLTTEGHRDVIEMREGLKEDRYNLRMPPPVPLVPRARRLGVKERVRFDGKVATPLDPRSLAAGIERLKHAGCASVAVCYLHSYRNARHEQATRRALERLMPGVYISLSSEVLPQIKEYERFGTTVVNAYVGPALATYLTRATSSSCNRTAAWRESRTPCGWPPEPCSRGPREASRVAGMPRACSRTGTSSPSTWAAPPRTSRCFRAASRN